MNKVQHSSANAPSIHVRRLPTRVGPIAEIALLVLAAVVADRLLWATPGSPFSQPLLLWVPVMLAAAQHGVMGGMSAALAATVAIFLVGVPLTAGNHDFYGYAAVLAGHPAGWVLYSLTFGALRSQQKQELEELRGDLTEAQAVSEGLTDGLERALAEIARLERRIAADTATVLALARSLERVDASDRRRLLSSFADVIQVATGATGLCIYEAAQSGFEPLVCRSAGTIGEAVAAPALSAKIESTWRTMPRTIAAGCGAAADLLPARAVCIVPVLAKMPAAAGEALIGAILVLELPKERTSASAIARVEHLARAIGSIAKSLPGEVPR